MNLYSPKTKVRQVASRTLIKDRTQFAGYYDETSYDPTNELEALPQSPKISKKAEVAKGSLLKQAGSAVSQGVMNTAKQLGSEIAQQATTGSINYT